MPIAGRQSFYTDIILPVGGSSTASIKGSIDSVGCYEGEIVPIPTIYKDYQINCYRPYDINDTSPPVYNENALTMEEIDGIFSWVASKDNNMDFPDVSEKVVSVECTSVQPYIRAVDEREKIMCFAVTFRVWYVNEVRKRREVYHELQC